MMNAYDELIKRVVLQTFPSICSLLGPEGWLWVKAQIWQESSFNATARSSKGALGLMQLLPSTAKSFGVLDLLNPEQNVFGGVRYLRYLFGRFEEIPTYLERLKFAQACYNGGPGYPNVALALARKAEGLPYGFRAWVKAGQLPGNWQTWDTASKFLSDPNCKCGNKRPDHQQIIGYVSNIHAKHRFLLNQLCIGKSI